MVAINNWSKDRLKVESFKEGNKVGWKVSVILGGSRRVRKRFSTKADPDVEVNGSVIETNIILAAGESNGLVHCSRGSRCSRTFLRQVELHFRRLVIHDLRILRLPLDGVGRVGRVAG